MAFRFLEIKRSRSRRTPRIETNLYAPDVRTCHKLTEIETYLNDIVLGNLFSDKLRLSLLLTVYVSENEQITRISLVEFDVEINRGLIVFKRYSKTLVNSDVVSPPFRRSVFSRGIRPSCVKLICLVVFAAAGSNKFLFPRSVIEEPTREILRAFARPFGNGITS